MDTGSWWVRERRKEGDAEERRIHACVSVCLCVDLVALVACASASACSRKSVRDDARARRGRSTGPAHGREQEDVELVRCSVSMRQSQQQQFLLTTILVFATPPNAERKQAAANKCEWNRHKHACVGALG